MELSRLQKLCVRLFRACGMSLEATQVLVAWLSDRQLRILSSVVLEYYDEKGKLPTEAQMMGTIAAMLNAKKTTED